jgi:uncharacterized protein (TIGR02246 family)
MNEDVAGEHETRKLYLRLLDAWNDLSADDFANLFESDGNAVGLDCSQMDGQTAIRSSLADIFADHEPARYVGVVREMRFLSKDVVLLRAVAGMVPRGGTAPNENLSIQSLVATQEGGRWKIGLWHNTPAAFHGRPEVSEALLAELREALRPGR